jgi:hypothetical protein
VKSSQFEKDGNTNAVSECRSAVNIDADPDNANWLRIVRAERIARQNPQAKRIWETALKETRGSRSDALEPFYKRLKQAGIGESE